MPIAGAITIELACEHISLCPQRAMWWPARKTLIIADPHIGKDDTFRRAGIPVPASLAKADFARLSSLISTLGPQRLVVLGDFYHARPDAKDHGQAALRAWRESHPALDVTIVRGNHDVHAGPPPEALSICTLDEGEFDAPWVYRHHPAEDARGVVLAGHLHPGVTVVLGRREGKRVPCFHIEPGCVVLPAFGRFTGTSRVEVSPRGAVYAVSDDGVLQLPPAVLA